MPPRLRTEMTLAEREHALRADRLRKAFGMPERLAEFLHQNYRAIAKSFKVEGPKHHDHGYGDCYGKAKQYFLRRATWLMKDFPKANGGL